VVCDVPQQCTDAHCLLQLAPDAVAQNLTAAAGAAPAAGASMSAQPMMFPPFGMPQMAMGSTSTQADAMIALLTSINDKASAIQHALQQNPSKFSKALQVSCILLQALVLVACYKTSQACCLCCILLRCTVLPGARRRRRRRLAATSAQDHSGCTTCSGCAACIACEERQGRRWCGVACEGEHSIVLLLLLLQLLLLLCVLLTDARW
jgi:hypothetical protein